MKRRKYTPGRAIHNMLELDCEINLAHWIYLDDRPKHWSFLANMMFRTLQGMMKRGRLRKAHENEPKICC